MSFLIDTNILLRFFELQDPKNPEIVGALNVLRNGPDPVYTCAQVLIEYCCVATRPVEVNGLGLLLRDVDRKLTRIEAMFGCLPEPADMAARWRKVIIEHGVMGKQVHDARLVALAQAHGVTRLLTLNGTDFTRYQGVTPVSPAELLSL